MQANGKRNIENLFCGGAYYIIQNIKHLYKGRLKVNLLTIIIIYSLYKSSLIRKVGRSNTPKIYAQKM